MRLVMKFFPPLKRTGLPMAANRETNILDAPGQRVLSVVISPDGKSVVYSGRDRNMGFPPATPFIRVADLVIRKEWLRFADHSKGTRCASFLPDGRRIISGGLDPTMRIWNLDTGEELHELECDTQIANSALISPGSKFVIYSG